MGSSDCKGQLTPNELTKRWRKRCGYSPPILSICLLVKVLIFKNLYKKKIVEYSKMIDNLFEVNIHLSLCIDTGKGSTRLSCERFQII